MKHFSITSDQRHFFEKNHFVEFEDLLNSEELTKLRDAIGDRTNIFESFMVGRDMWRENAVVKQFVMRRRFAEIAAELTYKKPLRLAYDQLLHTPKDPEPLKSLPDLFHSDIRLSEMSGFQGIIGGLILHISPDITPMEKPLLSIEQEVDTVCPLPEKPGSAIFFTPNVPLTLQPIFELPNQTHLLIVYGEMNLIYTCVPKDPHTHDLKKLDYVFGDRLTTTTHPIVLK